MREGRVEALCVCVCVITNYLTTLLCDTTKKTKKQTTPANNIHHNQTSPKREREEEPTYTDPKDKLYPFSLSLLSLCLFLQNIKSSAAAVAVADYCWGGLEHLGLGVRVRIFQQFSPTTTSSVCWKKKSVL